MIEAIIFSKILAGVSGLFILLDFIFGIITINKLKIKGKRLFYLSGVAVIEFILVVLSILVLFM